MTEVYAEQPLASPGSANNSSVENNSGGTLGNNSSVENNSGGTLENNSSIENNSDGTLENNSSVENHSGGTLENERLVLYDLCHTYLSPPTNPIRHFHTTHTVHPSFAPPAVGVLHPNAPSPSPPSYQAGCGVSLPRLHYIDSGPRDGPVVLCLHGEPAWSFLYR